MLNLKKTILTVHGFNRPITNRNKYKFIIAISYVLVNLLTEILYKIVDPRMKDI